MLFKKKYALVAINGKRLGNKTFIRYVLIRYGSYKNNVFDRTKLIDVDPYFLDKSRSHQYTFDDDGFSLRSIDGKPTTIFSSEKRKYHYNPRFDVLMRVDSRPILFKAKNDKEAVKYYKSNEWKVK